MIKSIWFDDVEAKIYPSLNANIKTKILIIGGGITGISCAYELSNICDDITLVTMNDFFEGTTGFTSAKVTYQHGYIYHDIIKKNNIQKAKAYYELNKKGLDRIKEIVETEKIDCDFETVNSYLYSYNSEEANLKKELKAYNELGIKAKTSSIDGFDRIALEITDQANFHPLKYLSKLLEILAKKNIRIYRNTKVLEFKKNRVITKHYSITADTIIVATSYPIYTNHSVFFTKLIPTISYVLSGKPYKDIPNGNFINTKDPIVAFRNFNDQLIVSGMTHLSKELPDYNSKYQKLIDISKTHFGIENFTHLLTCCLLSVKSIIILILLRGLVVGE